MSLRNRLAPTRDLILVFAICAFPIHVWSSLNVLHKVPAWLKQYTTWDLFGIVAYNQLFTLIETLAVFLGVVFLAAVLPSRFLREKFVPQATIIVLLTSLVLVLAIYNDRILSLIGGKRELVFVLYMLAIAAFYVISIAFFHTLIRRSRKVEDTITSLANRIMVLSGVYIAIGLLSTVIILIRNI